MDVIPAADVDYITIAQVRAEGIDAAEADDPTITAKIKLWMEVVDRVTRQFFNRRDLDVFMEGRNSNLLQLGVPIIEVDTLRINHNLPQTGGEIVDPVFFQVFTSRTKPQDDRRNPKIKIVANRGNIFGSFGRTFRRGLFTTITGKFGFIEPDGTTPQAVQRAMLRLVVKDIKNPIEGDVTSGSGGGTSTGEKRREKTDLHEIEFFESAQSKKDGSTQTVTGDAEADRLLTLYKSPIGIGGSINDIPRVDDGARF